MSTIKIKQDLKNTIPFDPVEKKRLQTSLQEAVKMLVEIDDIKSYIKDVIETEKLDHGYDPKAIKGWINTEYNVEKAKKKLTELTETVSQADQLFGRKEVQ